MSWEKTKVEDLCEDVYSGGTPKSSIDEYYGGDIPWLRTQEVTFNRIRDTEKTITEQGISNSSAKWVPSDSVIVAMYGASAGRVAINKVPLTTNQACCNLVADPKEVDYRFLYYSLCDASSSLGGLSKGAAQRNLNGGIIKGFEIGVPPLSEQQRIADILSAFDDLIEVNRQRIERLERAARLLYREWFVHHRFPGHEHTPIVDGVPEGWERVPLGAVLTLQRGFDLPTRKRNPGPIPVFAATGVTGHHDEAKVEAPGVVTGRSGSLGTVNYIETDYWPLNTTLWVREFKKVPPLYAYHLLSEMSLEHYRGGAAVPTLNRNVVHEVEILLPRDSLMESFYNTVRPMYDQIKVLREQSERLQEARDILLPRLMSGEITV